MKKSFKSFDVRRAIETASMGGFTVSKQAYTTQTIVKTNCALICF